MTLQEAAKIILDQEQQIKVLDIRVDSLEEKIYKKDVQIKELEEYVAHIPECKGLTGECTCGLDKLLNKH